MQIIAALIAGMQEQLARIEKLEAVVLNFLSAWGRNSRKLHKLSNGG
jgi:hypothetical protein